MMRHFAFHRYRTLHCAAVSARWPSFVRRNVGRCGGVGARTRSIRFDRHRRVLKADRMQNGIYGSKLSKAKQLHGSSCSKQQVDFFSGNKSPPTEADLLDPYKYSLKHVYVAPVLARQPLDLKLNTVAPGAIEVSEVKKDGVANQVDIEVGSFLLIVNGRRATGDQNDFTPDRDGFRMVFAEKRKVPLNPEAPNAFLGEYKALDSFDYHIIRLNLLQCKPSNFKFAMGKGKRPCVGTSSDSKVIEAAGFHIGDKLITVDGVSVREKGHCVRIPVEIWSTWLWNDVRQKRSRRALKIKDRRCS